MATATTGTAQKPDAWKKTADGKWWILPDVELFHHGKFREGTEDEFHCSPQHIATLARNFKRFKSGDRPSLEPGVGIGHAKRPAEGEEFSDDDVFSDDSELNHGEILDARGPIWRDVDKECPSCHGKGCDGCGQRGAIKERTAFLDGDLGISDEAKEGIETGKLKRLSAEVKETPPEGCDGSGYTLVRCALLGFAPPQLKKLKGLQKPEAVQRFRDRVFMFSDLGGSKMPLPQQDELDDAGENANQTGGGMGREEAIEWLTEHGIDPVAMGVSDDTDDDKLLALVDVLADLRGEQVFADGQFEADDEPTREADRRNKLEHIHGFDDEDMGDTETYADDRGEPQEDLNENNSDYPYEMADDDSDQDEETRRSDEENREMDRTSGVRPYRPKGTMRFSEGAGRRESVEDLLAEVKGLRADMDVLKRNEVAVGKASARDRILTFGDTLIKAGKATPAGFEAPCPENPRGGDDFFRLWRAAHDTRVHTFSEIYNGHKRKVKKTELELAMDEMEQREPRRFSELSTQGRGANGKSVSPGLQEFDKIVSDRFAKERERLGMNGNGKK